MSGAMQTGHGGACVRTPSIPPLKRNTCKNYPAKQSVFSTVIGQNPGLGQTIPRTGTLTAGSGSALSMVHASLRWHMSAFAFPGTWAKGEKARSINKFNVLVGPFQDRAPSIVYEYRQSSPSRLSLMSTVSYNRRVHQHEKGPWLISAQIDGERHVLPASPLPE